MKFIAKKIKINNAQRKSNKIINFIFVKKKNWTFFSAVSLFSSLSFKLTYKKHNFFS